MKRFGIVLFCLVGINAITLSWLEDRSGGLIDISSLGRTGAKVPPGWTSEKRKVTVGTPRSEQTKEIIFYQNAIGMEFVLIPAGEFMMGSNNGDSDEKPVHKVRISEPFYMSIYEVTQEQYEKVMGKTPSRFKGSKNPVERVSWNDAVEFCRKLSEKTGVKVTLPTEAQWEYACRAGNTGKFGFGDSEDALGKYAWYKSNTRKTHGVGQKKPNSWGLYDMHGNVREWCSDWYADDYYSKSPVGNPQGSSSGTYRVGRGGLWAYSPRNCRSASRDWSNPPHRFGVDGFRVVVPQEF